MLALLLPNQLSNKAVLQLTGVVLQAAKRLQINVYVEKIPSYRYLTHLFPRLHIGFNKAVISV